MKTKINIKTLEIDEEERKRLLERWCLQKDECAKGRLIEGNLSLVASVVHKNFRRYESHFEDLFSVGSIGLMKAVNRFDIERGFELSTYAVPMIVGEVKKYLRDNHGHKIGRKQRRKLNSFYYYENIYPHKTDEELEGMAGFVPGEMRRITNLMNPSSLDAVMNGDGRTKMDFLEDKVNNFDEQIILRNLIERLEPRQKKLIVYRFFKGKTQQEASKELGVSQAQVSRIEKKALKELKKLIERDDTMNYQEDLIVKKIKRGDIKLDQINLSDLEKSVVKKYMVADEPLAEVAGDIGKSKGYICNLKKSAVEKIQNNKMTTEKKEVVKEDTKRKEVVKEAGVFLLVIYKDGEIDKVSSLKTTTLRRIRDSLDKDPDVKEVTMAVKL